MQREYMKKHLFSLCNKLLQFKNVNLTDDFLEVIGYVLGGKIRKKIMMELFRDLIYFTENGYSELGLFWFKEDSSDDCQRFLERANWADLYSCNEEENDCFLEIKKRFFKDINIKNKSIEIDTEYSIESELFGDAIEEVLSLYAFNIIGLRDLLYKYFLKVEDYYSEQVTEYPATFKCISKVFNLTQIQKEILFVYFMFEHVESFEDFIRFSNFDFRELKKVSWSLSKLLGRSQVKIKRELRNSSKLIQSRLLKKDDKDLEISTHIYEYLQNDEADVDIFSFFFESEQQEETLPLNQHRINNDSLKTILNLLKSNNGTNILLHGCPGTGKTEFSKSLGKELGMTVYNIKSHVDDKEEMMSEKKSAIMAATTVLEGMGSILVIDEAEQLLSSERSIFYKDDSDHKAWVNTLLECHNINVIWITNDMTMHQSTKRRFDMAVEFKPFTLSQREDALKRIQSRYSNEVFKNDEISEVAANYELDPGALTLAFKKSAFMQGEDKREMVHTMLSSQKKLLNDSDSLERGLDKSYDPTLLNSSFSVDKIESIVTHFYKDKPTHNLCILLQGVPGTGKTEFGKYLTTKLEKQLRVKRTSDILSSMWGGTEKNIAMMFQNIDIKNKVLFLDECDSLFKSRESAEYSWMTSETNELLTQMEKFRGVLICATNFVEKLDRAALRRFHLKVELSPLTSEGLTKLYQNYFGHLESKNVDTKYLEQVSRLHGLTPGDFKAVQVTSILNESMTHEDIIERLKEELSYKVLTGNKVGFSV